MTKTAIGAPAPKPDKDDIIAALSSMTLYELDEIALKINEIFEKANRKKNAEDYVTKWENHYETERERLRKMWGPND